MTHAQTQCPVCAWRENCVKKYSLKESAMACPDFTRDVTLPEEEPEQKPAQVSHKKLFDPFAK